MNDLYKIKKEVLSKIMLENIEAIKQKILKGNGVTNFLEIQHLSSNIQTISKDLIRREMDEIDSFDKKNEKNSNNIITTRNKEKDDILEPILNKYPIILNAQQGNTCYYRNILIPELKPRAFSCFFVLGKHPNTPLNVETIYELASEYKVDGRGLELIKGTSLPRPSTIRSEIRDALKKGTEKHRDKINEQEIMNLLDSSKQGKITLQVPQEQILVIGPLDDIGEIVI